MKRITNELIKKFREYLLNEEKAVATIEKYIHDVLVFMTWMAGAEVTKMAVLEYKQELTEKYAPASVNGLLDSTLSGDTERADFYAELGNDRSVIVQITNAVIRKIKNMLVAS